MSGSFFISKKIPDLFIFLSQDESLKTLFIKFFYNSKTCINFWSCAFMPIGFKSSTLNNFRIKNVAKDLSSSSKSFNFTFRLEFD